MLQHEPYREIYLTGCAKEIWEQITHKPISIEDLLRVMGDKYGMDSVLKLLEKMIGIGFLSIKDHLWKDDGYV